MKLQDLMTTDVKTCQPNDNLGTAAHLMWTADCGAVPVIDAERHLLGMLTDRDICMAAYTQGKPLHHIPVELAMSRTVHSAGPKDDVDAALNLMQREQVHRLPVVEEDGCLAGLVSMNDLVRESARTGRTRPGVTAEKLTAALAAIGTRRPKD